MENEFGNNNELTKVQKELLARIFDFGYIALREHFSGMGYEKDIIKIKSVMDEQFGIDKFNIFKK